MTNKKDSTVALLQLMRGPQPDQAAFKILKVVTTEPDPYTFVFEGTPQALGMALFEIPIGLYPLRAGDRLLVFPLVGNPEGMRWAAVEKINGGVVMATMQTATSLLVGGIGREYTAADLIIPPYFSVSDANSQYQTSDFYLKSGDIRPLKAGDLVSIAPTLVNGQIKYVILEKY
ncbi:hypothetical protein ACF5W4_11080 [Bacillota bacterium Lsc_1132]